MNLPLAAGRALQALLLGLLLSFAIGRLVAESSGARVFKYEAY